jgi:uncharacterized repeat protein (TIGR01451 family)
MKSVISALHYAPKRTVALFVALAAAVIVPATLLAWGPDRPTFTEQTPATYVTFNSITNNSVYGDERNFATIKDAADTSNGNWQDTVTAQPGKEYVVRMYVHNNAAANLNQVAHNVRVSAAVPTTTGKSVPISSFVSADNANPAKIWDDVQLTSSQDFNLAYVPGSATFHNNSVGKAPQGVALPDSIVTSAGAQLGYDQLNGDIPGCYQYSGFVYFKVRLQFAPTETPNTNYTVKKEVRKAGSTDGFKDSVQVNPGDTVNFRLEVANTGNDTLKNVNLKDKLPAGFAFVPGTVKINNAANKNGAAVTDGDNLVKNGVNIGNYTGGANALVVFDAKVAAEKDLPACGMNTLVNTAVAQPENQTPQEASAKVNVNKVCQPGETPPAELPQTGIIDTSAWVYSGIGVSAAGAGYALTSNRVRKLFRR